MPNISIKYFFNTTLLYFLCSTLFVFGKTTLEENDNSYHSVDAIQKLMLEGNLKKAKSEAEDWVDVILKTHGKLSIHENIPRFILGRVCLQRQEYGEAIVNFSRCKEIIEKTTGWMYPDYAIILNHLATVLIRVGDIEESENILNRVLTVHEKVVGKRNKNYAHYLLNKGLIAQAEGRVEEAEFNFKEGKKYVHFSPFNRSFDVNFLELDIYLGNLYTQTYRQDKAKTIFHSLLEKMEDEGFNNSANYARVLLLLGEAYQKDGEYNKALEKYTKASVISEKLVDTDHFAFVHVQQKIAKLFVLQSKFKPAEILLQKTATVYKNDKVQKRRYATALLDLINLYLITGRYEKAKLYFLEIDKILGDDKEDFYYFKNTKSRYDIIYGYFVEAEMSMTEVLTLMEKNNRRHLRDFSLTSLGLIELNIYLGRTARATKTLDNGFKFLKLINQDSSLNYVDALICRAFLYETENKPKNALQDLTKAKELLVKLFSKNHFKIAVIDSHLANSYNLLNKTDSAAFFYKAAIERYQYYVEPEEIRFIRVRKQYADFLLQQNRLDEAEIIFSELKGLPITGTLIHTSTIGSQAYLYSLQGKFSDANEVIIEALRERIKFYDRTLSFSSTQEKGQYLTQTKSLFEIFYSILERQGNKVSTDIIKECVNFQIKYNSYFLKDTKERIAYLNRYSKDRKKEGFPNYTDYMYLLRDRIASLNYLSEEERYNLDVDPYKTIDKINTLEKTLVYAANAYADSIAEVKQVTWIDIKKNIKKGEALIEIIKLNTIHSDSAKYIAVYIDGNSIAPEVITLGDAELFDSKAFYEYQRQSTPLGRSLVFVNAETIKYDPYNTFWKPISNFLEKKNNPIDKVYFCPDGIYHLININTLQNPESGKYVIEDKFIYQISTPTEILRKQTSKENLNKTALLVGNPKFHADGNSKNTSRVVNAKGLDIRLDDLPGTEVEIEISENLLKQKGWDVQVKKREEATEQLFKNMEVSPTVIHIATHGFFINNLKSGLNNSPLLKSGLFFSEFSKRNERSVEDIYLSGIDGILTAYEVVTLNLQNTELIILSACQTGVSDVGEGEGISGLQFAFTIAGVKSIIMSLWSVDDIATQKLMSHFYENWNRLGDKHQAFREAQVQIMKEYKKPYYWGAFVLVN